jgi:hypothetical protein
MKIARQITCLNPSPSLLANRERLWTFDMDKSHIRGRYNFVRVIKRSHCQPFCAHVSAQLKWIHTCTLLIKRNCLVKIFSVSCVSIFGTKGSLIPIVRRVNVHYFPYGYSILPPSFSPSFLKIFATGSHYAAKAGLKLMILLPQSLKY